MPQGRVATHVASGPARPFPRCSQRLASILCCSPKTCRSCSPTTSRESWLSRVRGRRRPGGALLMELTLGERIELAGESGEARKGTVVVRDGSPTGDDLLDEALATLGRQSWSRPALRATRSGPPPGPPSGCRASPRSPRPAPRPPRCRGRGASMKPRERLRQRRDSPSSMIPPWETRRTVSPRNRSAASSTTLRSRPTTSWPVSPNIAPSRSPSSQAA